MQLSWCAGQPFKNWVCHKVSVEAPAAVTPSCLVSVCLQAFAAWKQHQEDLRLEKAVSHDTWRHSARALTAWQLGLALIHRKRSLIAAAKELVKQHRLQHSVSAWMRHTYYKHMGHVALHFRVRRLACVVLREWQEVGCCCMPPVMTCSEASRNAAARPRVWLWFDREQMVRSSFGPLLTVKALPLPAATASRTTGSSPARRGAQHGTTADAPAGSQLCHQGADWLAADAAGPGARAEAHTAGLPGLLGLVGA